jgi:hypothetical protein
MGMIRTDHLGATFHDLPRNQFVKTVDTPANSLPRFKDPSFITDTG